MHSPQLRKAFGRYTSAPGVKAVLLLVFIVFVATLISSFSKRVFGMALAFDSAMYLHSASCVLASLQSLASLKLPDAHTYKLLVDGMLLDGPILPLIGGLFFAVFGLKPEVQNIQAALVLQAGLQTLSALLVYKVALALINKRKPALVAGYLWGLYPAAVLGAGKFMTENLTCCLIMALVLAIGRMSKKSSAFAAGALLCMVALTKAALTPAAALAIIFGLGALARNGHGKKQLYKTAIATMCGAAAVLAPWLFFTHFSTGQALLTASRQPTHNLISGVNPENDGWASLPDTPLGLMFNEDDPPLASGVGVALPIAHFELQLMARKVTRLFSQPWNDYRLHCLGLPDFVQIFWHRMIIALAVLGMIALAIKQYGSSLKYVPTRQELTFCLLLIMAAGHLIYLPFVACNRYGFTAMPILVVLATAGAAAVFALGRKAPAVAITLLVVAFLLQLNVARIIPDGLLIESHLDLLAWAAAIKVITCLLAINYIVRLLKKLNGIVRTSWANNVFLALITTGLLCTTAADTYYEPLNGERTFQITKNDPLMRVCRLGAKELSDPNLSAAYLVIDSRLEKAISGTVDVNGHFLPLALSPFCALNPQTNLAACYEMFAKLRSHKACDLRQWYALQLPIDTLKAGLNSIVVAPSGHSQLPVNGSVKARPLQGQYVELPSLTLFSPTILGNDLGSIDARPRENLYVASGESERPNAGGAALAASTAKSNANVLVLLIYNQKATEANPHSNINLNPKQVNLSNCLMVPH